MTSSLVPRTNRNAVARPHGLVSLLASLFALIALFPAASEAKSTMLNISSSVVGLLVLAVDLVAIFEVMNSSRTVGGKILWALFIFVFPVFGVLIYLYVVQNQTSQPRSLFGRKNSTQYEPIASA
ncbi:hypothetical protein HDU86_002185 [Geranomyces michiganensis]|nr:hypothetical protein HDU86_002185 [Geranomyces michiganensis]